MILANYATSSRKEKKYDGLFNSIHSRFIFFYFTRTIKSYLANLQVFFSGTEGTGLFGDDEFCDDFIMDEIDINIENYEEICGVNLNNQEQLFDDDEINGIFGMRDMSGANFNCPGAYAAEVILCTASALNYQISIAACDLLIFY